MSENINIKFTGGWASDAEKKQYDQLLCWYCGKSRRVWPPNGCILTHKDDLLKDAMYPEQDPYKSKRDKDGKIIRPPIR